MCSTPSAVLYSFFRSSTASMRLNNPVEIFSHYGKAWPEDEAIQRHREGGRPSRMAGHLRNTYHISHTQCTITCIPVLTHFSLTARSSLSHTHRFLGFRNSTPGILPAFSARLMTLLRVSVSRVACAHAPSPCPRSSLTHTHRFLGSRNSTPGNLPACSERLFCILCVPDDRDSVCVPSPSLSSMYSMMLSPVCEGP